MLAVMQLPHGWRSVTSHLTRRALHVTHASFARFRGGCSEDDIVSACLSGRSRLDFGYQPRATAPLGAWLLAAIRQVRQLGVVSSCWSSDRCSEVQPRPRDILPNLK
jgi:hypothetical protein